MNFYPQQAKAIKLFEDWFNSPNKKRPWFQLSGYPGTGKSFISKHLTAGINGKVFYVAATGKAAYRLIQLGVGNVSTFHKLVYVPANKSQQRLKDLEAERAQLLTHKPIPEELIHKLDVVILAEKKNLDRPLFKLNLESPAYGAALIVVDEHSMINEVMGEDLLSFGVPILALGDPDQLPPVTGKSFFGLDHDILLTDIRRQAMDNPIIYMAKEIREGRELKPGKYGESEVVYLRNIEKDDLASRILKADQLLVGKNATRKTCNNRVRELRELGNKYPLKGDKLVCLRNNHEIGILNGQLWSVVQDSCNYLTNVVLNIENDEGEKIEVNAHSHYFEGTEPDFWEIQTAQSFDYGYALTVHKSQGSEFSNVVLLDEWYNKNRREWLNTAVTRATNQITIVKM